MKNSGCDATDGFGDISAEPVLLRHSIERLTSEPQPNDHVDLNIVGRDHWRSPTESCVDDHTGYIGILLKSQSRRRAVHFVPGDIPQVLIDYFPNRQLSVMRTHEVVVHVAKKMSMPSVAIRRVASL